MRPALGAFYLVLLRRASAPAPEPGRLLAGHSSVVEAASRALVEDSGAPQSSSGGQEGSAHQAGGAQENRTDLLAAGGASSADSEAEHHKFRQGLRLGLATLSTLLLVLSGGLVASYALEHGRTPLGHINCSKPRLLGEADGGIRALETGTLGQVESGELDQPWYEELGLCATQSGRERWYCKSEVDPANFHANHARAYPAEDGSGWSGRGSINRGAAGAGRSREEGRILNLHPKLLERERYVIVNFWKLLLKGMWANEPAGYPGPGFETRAEFVRGTRPRRWPLGLEGTEDTRVSDCRGPQLAAHLCAFVWRNNSDGSLKASMIMIFLGLVPFLRNLLMGVVVEQVNPMSEEAGEFIPLDAWRSMWLEYRTIMLVLSLFGLEVISHYVSFRFWTVVPKYGVLRQFQSYFGRRCLQILMTQATPQDNRLECVHEGRFRDSPGLCQAMTNYCCEAVVLNLWGKSFDQTRAKTTMVTSVVLILYAMAFKPPPGVPHSSYIEDFWRSFCHYGWCIFLFFALSYMLFSLNVMFRLNHSVDLWGLATKTKLNMMSLQQELTHRMMSTGKKRQGAPVTAADQKLLDDACSDWHDACRIYGNRDFHTWFCSWIVTDEFNNMLNSFSVMMCVIVLGIEVIGGRMCVGTFVMAIGSVRSINEAAASALNYNFSLPEGYVCLLYLAQVCNMNVPGDEEDNDEEELGDECLNGDHMLTIHSDTGLLCMNGDYHAELSESSSE